MRRAETALESFVPRFETAFHGGLSRKLGLTQAHEGDAALAGDLLKIMAANRADFTLAFRRLGEETQGSAEREPVRDLFLDPTAFDDWAERWRQRLANEPRDDADRRAGMRAVNPAYIARNHHVEAALEAAVERADLGPFEDLLAVLSRPYEDQPGLERYASSPEPDGSPYRTFCGT